MRSELLHSKEIAKKRLLIEAQNTVSSMTLDQMEQIKKEISNILSRHLDLSSDKYEIRIILKEDKKRE